MMLITVAVASIPTYTASKTIHLQQVSLTQYFALHCTSTVWTVPFSVHEPSELAPQHLHLSPLILPLHRLRRRSLKFFSSSLRAIPWPRHWPLPKYLRQQNGCLPYSDSSCHPHGLPLPPQNRHQRSHLYLLQERLAGVVTVVTI